MFDPISLGLGYGAWKLGKYFYDEYNSAATPPDPRREAEIKELASEPMYIVVAILAKFAKADGVVTSNEIAVVEQILRDIELTGENRTKAIGIFRKYKDGPLTYDESLAIFAGLTDDSTNLRAELCIFLLRVAHADGIPPQRSIEAVCEACSVCGFDYDEVHQFFQNQESLRREAITADYELLGLSPGDSPEIIKTRYRYLTKTFHPDTIAGKDLPPEFTKVAEAKFRDIKDAYERIIARNSTIICAPIVERNEIECPHCGEDVEVDGDGDGDGEYTCPECGEDFVVGDRDSDEPEVQCPFCNNPIEVVDDGEYICPWCEEDLTVLDGEPVGPHEVECPHCNNDIEVAGDGEYICPWCKEDVTVEDGEPVEPYEIECPHCGEDVEVDGDGQYTCPECGEDFVVGDD